MGGRYISFAAFFLMWAERQGWEVPDIHIQICYWMEHREELGVLQVFRGCGKSTILSVYNAWKYYIDPTYRILHQGDQDKTAYKTSRDTKNVLENHPLTKKMAATNRGESAFWWTGAGFIADPRNPSMQAAGILSNITSSRADEIQNDDVEVQKNVETPEAREKLRTRLDEQVHIAVPGARHLYVGTPHTHNSIYDDQIALGADNLKIPLFRKEQRFTEAAVATRYRCGFVPDMVFLGIGKYAKELKVGVDFKLDGTTLVFRKPPGATLDCYADNAWPERFTPKEMVARRKKCATLNKWDSQYQLHSKPVTDVRIDPEKIIPYDCQPEIRMVNRKVGMWLANTQIVGCVAWWDCSLGKVNSDASAFVVVLTDAAGRLYLQVAENLKGNIDVQCKRVRELVIQYQIPRVTIETNGPGGHVPAILRKHLKRTGCGVGEHHETKNKNKRILDAWEAPLDSGFLWAHVDTLLDEEGDKGYSQFWNECMEWNPKVTEQPDDFLDAGAGAITATPVRIGKVVGKPAGHNQENWVPNQGQFEVSLEK